MRNMHSFRLRRDLHTHKQRTPPSHTQCSLPELVGVRVFATLYTYVMGSQEFIGYCPDVEYDECDDDHMSVV